MTKNKNLFSCSSCNHQTTKWMGCCPSCKEWNTLGEDSPISSIAPIFAQKQSTGKSLSMHTIDAIQKKPKNRLTSSIKEWNRVTGGGIMPGSFMILTGDPGIGKSTLMLHITHELAEKYKVLYFSSEESLEQVALRAERIGCANTRLLFSDQAQIDDIITTAYQHKPDLIVIDSIQNCYTSNLNVLPGSVGQLKESAFRLMRLAKEHTIAILLTGHITKDGAMAGPKTLEHMVDAVFYLQGEDRWQTRILRSVKNRFGTVNELGFFEMHEQGLREMPNINQQLLEGITENPGSALISVIEGSRPLLIELQALTIASKFTMPQRIVSGIDEKQVTLIAAILEKYLHIKFSAHDIFFKISGGFKIKESAADLGIALALLSSYFQQPLPAKCIALGEISLTGHIKPINHLGLHINEAEKFGIQKLCVARNQKIDRPFCPLKQFSNVYELLSLFKE